MTMQDTNDETLNPTDDTDTEDQQVLWDCFSCGKHLGEQGNGGSFTLNFGYGSGLDNTRGINGWICDECVAQKHGRLRVSNGANGMEHWLERNQRPVAEHEETKYVRDLDFFGRKNVTWAFDNDMRPCKVEGWRLYYSLTAEERSRVEAWLFNEEPIDRDLVVKLLKALMESEAARAEAEAWAHEQGINALDRARQQAERLSAEELAQLRARESRDSYRGDRMVDTRRIWEHAEWNEKHFRKQEEVMAEQRDRIKELEAANTALRERLKWGR